MTLVGTELLLENGRRIPVDTATARNFRYLAASLPKTRELAKRLAPVWAKAGLPEPTSPAQARLAIAAFKGSASASDALRGLLANAPLASSALPGAPIIKPTLVADCDPVFTFCGFDTGEDPNSGGGAGSGGGSGDGGSQPGTSPCISLFTQLYYATANWRTAVATLEYFRASLTECVLNHAFDWPATCSQEALRLTIGIATLAFYDAQMQGVAEALRALHCI
jgi:hypothetical protein